MAGFFFDNYHRIFRWDPAANHTHTCFAAAAAVVVVAVVAAVQGRQDLPFL